MVSSREEITHTLALNKGQRDFTVLVTGNIRRVGSLENLLSCPLLENRYIAAGSSIAEPWRDRSRLLEWKREDTMERFDREEVLRPHMGDSWICFRSLETLG